MGRQHEVKEKPRHILDENPDQISLPVIGSKIAAIACAARANMPHYRLGEIKERMPSQLKPHVEVGIFHVREELFIKPAHLLEGTAGIGCGCRAGTHHKPGANRAFGCRLVVVLPPYKPTRVADVPFPIQKGGIAIKQETRSEAVIGMSHRRLVERLEPSFLREGVVVQRHDVFPRCRPCGEVVSTSETQVGFRTKEFNRNVLNTCQNFRVWRSAGTVIEQDYLKIPECLCLERLQAALQILFTLPEQDQNRKKRLAHVQFLAYDIIV